MEILIAEDEKDIAFAYKHALEERKHHVTAVYNGEDCLRAYNDKLHLIKMEAGNDRSFKYLPKSPFDVVILDYKMPKMNGIDVAKEIFNLNPDQRIIFASAYVKSTLEESIKQLKLVVEVMQKPFKVKALIDTIEDREVQEGLKMLMANLRQIQIDNKKKGEIEPTQEQIRGLFEGLRKIQKGRTF